VVMRMQKTLFDFLDENEEIEDVQEKIIDT
jgi:hypothetical protein